MSIIFERRWAWAVLDEALAALDLDSVQSNGFGFQVELNYLCHRAGLRLVEVPIVFPDRTAGRSKMSWRITLEAVALVWRLKRRQDASLPAHPTAAATVQHVHPPVWQPSTP